MIDQPATKVIVRSNCKLRDTCIAAILEKGRNKFVARLLRSGDESSFPAKLQKSSGSAKKTVQALTVLRKAMHFVPTVA
ncbi:MAG TPA: hypothetical protein VFB72_16865 [Verrucomicrobiae bacterium]|nr:hypothetical protein [Verrucomicrobiae bacterium]